MAQKLLLYFEAKQGTQNIMFQLFSFFYIKLLQQKCFHCIKTTFIWCIFFWCIFFHQNFLSGCAYCVDNRGVDCIGEKPTNHWFPHVGPLNTSNLQADVLRTLADIFHLFLYFLKGYILPGTCELPLFCCYQKQIGHSRVRFSLHLNKRGSILYYNFDTYFCDSILTAPNVQSLTHNPLKCWEKKINLVST